MKNPSRETTQVVVLQSVQPVTVDLLAAFPLEQFETRILSSGSVEEAVRSGVSATVPVDTFPRHLWRQRLDEIRASGPGPLELVTNDEYCLELCSALRRALGLPAHLGGRPARYRDKVLMKEALVVGGVAVPEFLSLEPVPSPSEKALDAIVGVVGLPLVVKPRKEANNRGVAVIDSRSGLKQWLEENAGCGGWEVEAFVEGPLFHVNALVNEGRVEPLLVGEYLGSLLALGEGGAIGSITLPPDAPAAQEGHALNARAVEALGGSGRFVVHTEFVLEPSGRAVLLETAARAPGGLISEMAEIHIGLNLEEVNLRAQAGASGPTPTRTGLFSGWMWLPSPTADEDLPPLPAPNIEHRLQVPPARPPIAVALLAWDPDLGRLREEIFAAAGLAVEG